MTKAWNEQVVARVASAVREIRESRTPKLSVAKLAQKTAELGYPMTRTVIADLELGRRRGIDVAELLVLAAALDVPPVLLLYPNLPDGEVEHLPGQRTESIWAAMQFGGEVIRNAESNDEAKRLYSGQDRVRLSRELYNLRQYHGLLMMELSQVKHFGAADQLGPLESRLDRVEQDVERLKARIQAEGWPVRS